MHKRAVKLAVKDIKSLLLEGNAHGALRRLNLFDYMYLQEEDECEVEMSNRHVMVLLVDTGDLIICDEYYPEDGGRVHMIPTHKYALFNANNMTLEWSKVSLDVIEIVYLANEWPTELQGKGYAAIAAHYLGSPT